MVLGNLRKDTKMSEIKHHQLYEDMWWTSGQCKVKVLRTGHFPTSAIVRLPNDKETEVEVIELTGWGQVDGGA